MSVIEWIAAILGVIGVWLSVRQNILTFPIGIICVGIYAWIFFSVKLYSDAILQILYIFFQIHGWYRWIHKDREGEVLHVRSESALSNWILYLSIWIGGSFLLGYFMQNYSDASLPYQDASIVALSLIAQYLLNRKILENWILWMIVNTASVFLYYYKELYPTSGLYVIFLALAVLGYKEWNRMKTAKAEKD